MNEVTEILGVIEKGDPTAAERLLPLVYGELRKLAAHKLARETSDRAPQATSLVHQAYIRLIDAEKAQHWNSRGHFFAAAAEAMRRILVEDARRRTSLKYGGHLHRVADVELVAADEDAQIVALNDALERLATECPIAAKVVELHHFAGLSHEVVAETLGISVYEARQKWCYARAWLQVAMLTDR